MLFYFVIIYGVESFLFYESLLWESKWKDYQKILDSLYLMKIIGYRNLKPHVVTCS